MSDYIKRADALEIINNNLSRFMIALRIGDCPSADVAPIRRGHWICNCCDIVCSECGTAFSDEVCYMMRDDVSYHEPKHCLWCGAEMSKDTEY